MVFSYLRVSSIAQDEQNQRMGIEQKAKSLGIIIDKYYIDKVSGITEPDKRNLGKLLKKVKEGDIIIVSELSRLARNMLLMFRIIETLLNKKIHLYSVKDNFVLDDSLQSKILVFAFGIASQVERDMISARTKEALARKKLEGIHLGRKFGAKILCKRLVDNQDKIMKMYYNGVSKAKIARKYKVTDKTIRKYIRLWNL